MNEVTLAVTGMTCGGCVASVNRVLKALPGVKSVEVSLTPGQAKVAYDENAVPRVALEKAIRDAGFTVP